MNKKIHFVPKGTTDPGSNLFSINISSLKGCKPQIWLNQFIYCTVKNIF